MGRRADQCGGAWPHAPATRGEARGPVGCPPPLESLPAEEKEKEKEQLEGVLRRVWEVLVQTQVTSGKLVCASCGHEFGIQSGIANFLLPGHLV